MLIDRSLFGLLSVGDILLCWISAVDLFALLAIHSGGAGGQG